MHDYLLGLTGGLIIGTAASALFVLNGRIMGVSAVLSGAMQVRSPDAPWRWAFLVGMLGAGAASYAWMPSAFADTVHPSLGVCLFSGLLVGVGTQLGSGCTSGHGICGIGSASPRSLIATVVFITTGSITVFVVRHVLSGSV